MRGDVCSAGDAVVPGSLPAEAEKAAAAPEAAVQRGGGCDQDAGRRCVLGAGMRPGKAGTARGTAAVRVAGKGVPAPGPRRLLPPVRRRGMVGCPVPMICRQPAPPQARRPGGSAPRRPSRGMCAYPAGSGAAANPAAGPHGRPGAGAGIAA